MDISTEIAAVQAASEGSELRQPLVSALNKLNSGTLPAVTVSDVGKILKVGANGWEVGEKSGYMPVPTATKQITENGTYDVTDYASAIVGVSGGSGGTTIFSGTDAPIASHGIDGDVYFQTKLVHLLCSEGYLVDSTSQLLATHGSAFYKITNDPAIAVHYKINSGNYIGYYGPLLISPFEDAVKITNNTTPLGSTTIDGVTWYLSSTNSWSRSADAPTIQTMYDGSNPQALSSNVDTVVRLILDASNGSYSSEGMEIIASAYCKVSGVWRNLIGTDISDVNTGN